eukprot:TRINITY_DN10946_c0_g1_i1.p1 TRINITY_DN10946_c0_g1~~TRINITY_DN10946_c0_g1_i1.p1  ORF type:complete len:459 (+),score=127.48 TRINITY_DN10946_c0_g1_i1:43-1419(+)
MAKLSAYDLYRKIPTDLTAGTSQGGMLSMSCVVLMILLVTMETWHYLQPPIVSDLTLDTNIEPRIRINFNITALEMPCDWVSVDVKDRLGVNRVDVVQNIKKEEHTQFQQLLEYNEPQRVKQNIVHGSMEEMDKAMKEEGESPHLNKESFEAIVQDKTYVFVDFYAPWCIWCKRLAPTWEEFAKKMHDEHYHIAVRKVNCMENYPLCSQQKIKAFPTMRLFKNGRGIADFSGQRDIDGITAWSSAITGEDELDHHLREKEIKGMNEDHLGCRVSGHILVNRVPGNFHLVVKSDVHSINPKETNLSHVVHELSFGEPLPERTKALLPKHHGDLLGPLNNKWFSTKEPHITFEHYMKVLTTTYRLGWREVKGYQVQHSNHQYLFEEQHAYDDDGRVPEARFSYDFSPTAVIVQYSGRRWYEFITNLCAIVGGVFTVMGLLDRSLHGVRTRIFKEQAGKLG